MAYIKGGYNMSIDEIKEILYRVYDIDEDYGDESLRCPSSGHGLRWSN